MLSEDSHARLLSNKHNVILVILLGLVPVPGMDPKLGWSLDGMFWTIRMSKNVLDVISKHSV